MNPKLFRLALLVALVATATPAWAQRDSRDSRDSNRRETRQRQTSADFAASEQKKGTAASKVASQLRGDYREGTDRIGGILMKAGYDPPQVMHALIAEGVSLGQATLQMGRNAGSGTDTGEVYEMAQTLADGGYSAAEVAEVLVAVYDADAEMIAGALKNAGYPVLDIVGALASGGSITPDVGAQTAQALRAAGFTCTEVLEGLQFYNRRDSTKVRSLYQAGCTREEVQVALEAVYNAGMLAYMLSWSLQP